MEKWLKHFWNFLSVALQCGKDRKWKCTHGCQLRESGNENREPMRPNLRHVEVVLCLGQTVAVVGDVVGTWFSHFFTIVTGMLRGSFLGVHCDSNSYSISLCLLAFYGSKPSRESILSHGCRLQKPWRHVND